MNFNNDDECHHFIVYFLGTQEDFYSDHSDGKFYNCLECETTISIRDEDLWLYTVVEEPIQQVNEIQEMK